MKQLTKQVYCSTTDYEAKSLNVCDISKDIDYEAKSLDVCDISKDIDYEDKSLDVCDILKDINYEAKSLDVCDILKDIKLKNENRLVIGNLNINSIARKFDQLKAIIQGHVDILIVVETKLDSTYPTSQFLIDGYSKPYRLDRNRNGGGILIYVREDIPTKQTF